LRVTKLWWVSASVPTLAPVACISFFSLGANVMILKACTLARFDLTTLGSSSHGGRWETIALDHDGQSQGSILKLLFLGILIHFLQRSGGFNTCYNNPHLLVAPTEWTISITEWRKTY
jgi:hypothetical protein